MSSLELSITMTRTGWVLTVVGVIFLVVAAMVGCLETYLHFQAPVAVLQ